MGNISRKSKKKLIQKMKATYGWFLIRSPEQIWGILK